MKPTSEILSQARSRQLNRRPVARLVGVPGMSDPAASNPTMLAQYEGAARVGLNRVHARYALTIPFALAFYDDIWRANERRLQATQLPRDLDRFGPYMQLYPLEKDEDPRRVWLEVGLALEMLFKGRGSTDAHLLSADKLRDHGPGERVKLNLWQCATTIATYLTTPYLREKALARVAAEIEAGDDEVVLLAHGLGSVVCYDLLLSRPDLPVRCLVTLGSPLGLEGVRSAVADMRGLDVSGNDATMPFPTELPRWINLYNSGDNVTSGHLLKGMYVPGTQSDVRHVEDIDTGLLQRPALTAQFAEHHPATYLSSKVAGLVLRSVVEE